MTSHNTEKESDQTIWLFPQSLICHTNTISELLFDKPIFLMSIPIEREIYYLNKISQSNNEKEMNWPLDSRNIFKSNKSNKVPWMSSSAVIKLRSCWSWCKKNSD